jgi:hypothetical protein
MAVVARELVDRGIPPEVWRRWSLRFLDLLFDEIEGARERRRDSLDRHLAACEARGVPPRVTYAIPVD